jgi:GntR family transcriptional regulator, transcriptional repressor for pyruvate dehydrogenase complex
VTEPSDAEVMPSWTPEDPLLASAAGSSQGLKGLRPVKGTAQSGGAATGKLSYQVARQLSQLINAQRLEVGHSLPKEAELILLLGVSRGTLREALRILELVGIVTLRTGRYGGPVVGEADARQFGELASMYLNTKRATLRDVLEARIAVEPFMARLAAQRRAAMPADVQRAFSSEPDLLSDEIWTETTTDLHRRLADLSGNPVISLFGRSMLELYLARAEKGLLRPAEDRQRVHEAHKSIVVAIHAGDANSAESLMREHMIDLARYVIAAAGPAFDEVITW